MHCDVLFFTVAEERIALPFKRPAVMVGGGLKVFSATQFQATFTHHMCITFFFYLGYFL